MGRITVTIEDVAKRQKATIPDDAPIKLIIAKLITLMNLPSARYYFRLKRTGEILRDAETLAEAGVRDSYLLRLIYCGPVG